MHFLRISFSGLTLLALIAFTGSPAFGEEETLSKSKPILGKQRNWFAAPAPVSGPTFGTGLVAGGAYFWKQTEAQRDSQPGSVSGIAGFASENDSQALGIGHLGYMKDDKWRIGALAAYIDLNLELRSPDGSGGQASVDWLLEGGGFGGQVMRQVRGDWYAGLVVRYIDLDQDFSIVPPSPDFDVSSSTQTAGLGVKIEFDSRDDQFNAYQGQEFRFSILANSDALGSDLNYQAYSLAYSSYHPASKTAVLAWEVQGCHRSSATPLWDACTIDLRGFNTTSYIGRTSASAQVEYRWRFHHRWAAVAFAGGGYFTEPFTSFREEEVIPSYGGGLRFRILKSQRVNVRLDYARSKDDSALHLGISEAF